MMRLLITLVCLLGPWPAGFRRRPCPCGENHCYGRAYCPKGLP